MTAKPKSSGPRSAKPDLPSNAEQRIRRRAYELYEQRGRVDGCALDDWLQAEGEVAGTANYGSKSRRNLRRSTEF
jgi:Protein of unknown function (DUF2934)